MHGLGHGQSGMKFHFSLNWRQKGQRRSLFLSFYGLQVMASPVLGFKAVERVDTVVEMLRTTKFNGFPVFPADRYPFVHVCCALM